MTIFVLSSPIIQKLGSLKMNKILGFTGYKIRFHGFYSYLVMGYILTVPKKYLSLRDCKE